MKILLFLPNYIGDVLMSTPAIRVLKKKLSGVKIYVAIKDYVNDVISDNPYVHEIIYKTPKLSFWKKIRNEKFDYVVLFRTTFFNSLSTFIAKPEFSVGLNEEFSKLFLDKVINKETTRPYRYECVLLVKELLSYLGIDIDTDIDEEVRKLEFHGWGRIKVMNSFKQKMSMVKLEFDRPVIVLSPFASRRTKMLNTEQYIDIINKLFEIDKNIDVVLTGNTTDSQQQEMLNTILKSTVEKKVKSLCNQLTLKELGLLYSAAKLVVSTDTGIAYIAESIGVPTVIIFTSTLPEKYGPFAQNVRYVYSSTCPPCYKNECPDRTYKCIHQIDTGKIINIAKEILVKR